MNPGDRHIVPFIPGPPPIGPCPACGSKEARMTGFVLPGIHAMLDLHCPSCGAEYLEDLPIGFAVDHPMSIDKRGKRLYDAKPELDWIHAPLLRAYKAPDNEAVRVERKVFREHKRVIVLNTLDFLYGHVLLKLYNAAHYLERYPDHGLVVIIPKMFEWLVPEGTAEVWSVDLRLGRMHGWYPAIDAFVHERMAAYDEVLFGRGYAHPEFASIGIERFTGIAPFPLEEFDTRPPHITFVAREDRLWFGTPIGKFLYRVLLKFGLQKSIGRWFVAAQDRAIRRTMRAIREQLPSATFTVVGLARSGGYGALANDLRTTRMNDTVELDWVKAYARSQVVVGVHGSNMLLPTAHAAGCVEILPNDRFGNIVQDISVRWHDRMQVFMYRFVDEFAPPRTVARHVTAMFREFGNYHRNNRLNGFANER
ncbi:MAG: hypothetical protein R2815_13415 [Flavobacteriales bacterium]